MLWVAGLVVVLLSEGAIAAGRVEPAAVRVALTPGRVTGELYKNSETLGNGHRFEGRAGELVLIELKSEEFDPYLLLLNPNGELIAMNDYRGEDNRIVLELPETGTYLLLVSANSFHGGETGRYELLWRETTVAEIQAAERKAEADRLFQLGIEQFSVSQFGEALASWEAALEIYREIGDRRGETNSLVNLGAIYTDLEEYEEAIEVLRQSFAIAREIGYRRVEAASFGNLGIAYHKLGQYERAIDFLQQSIAIYREIGNQQGESTSLNTLGAIYTDLGQYEDAVEALQQSLAIAREIGRRRGEAASFGNLGSVHWSLGQYARGLEVLQQSIAIYREIGNQQGESSSLNTLGLIYHALGQYERAMSLYQQHLEIAREIGSRGGEVSSHANLGNSYFRLGEYEEAINFHQQSLEIAREIGDRIGEAASYGNLGMVYHNLGKYERAINFHQQQLEIAREIGARQHEVNSLINLGAIYCSLGKYEQAIEVHQQSLAIAQEMGDRQGVAITFKGLGHIYQKQDRPELAIALYKQSVEIYEAIRADLQNLPIEDQKAYIETISDFYRAFADLLIQQGRIIEAQQILELLKLQEIRDYRNDQRHASDDVLDLIVYKAERDILEKYDSLIAFGHTLAQCRFDSCPDLGQLNDEYDRLTREFDSDIQAFESEFRRRLSEDQSFLDPSQLDLDTRQLIEAQPGTVLVYPVVLEEELRLLMFAEGGAIAARSLPVSRLEIGNAAIQLRQSLETPTSDLDKLQTTAQQLYEWLIDPIEGELGANNIQHLIFALDRTTRYLPMGVLHDGDRYLIEKYTVTTILNAGQTQTDRLPLGTADNSILAAGVSQSHGDFNPLPNVLDEIDYIVRHERNPDERGIYPGLDLLDRAFDYTALRDNLGDRRFLHVATHGKFDPDDKDESFLLLGTGDRLKIRDTETPGDIETLSRHLHNLHLVVLSACETALGAPDAEGIEIPSISSYFLEGGAQAVLASLWQVSDPGTSQLMQTFYTNLATGTAAEPMTKAKALQQAQLSFIYSDRPWEDSAGVSRCSFCIPENVESGRRVGREHPYYWSPFVLIGNGL